MPVCLQAFYHRFYDHFPGYLVLVDCFSSYFGKERFKDNRHWYYISFLSLSQQYHSTEGSTKQMEGSLLAMHHLSNLS